MSETNLSALSALGTAQAVSANNIANVNTDDFKASSVSLETGPDGWGVRVGAIQESTNAGPIVGDVELSNTDLGREMVDMITTSRAFSANVAAVRVSEEMTGHLLNMIA
ncbi:flagellar basal body rod C-terminal domain-containing protein [Pseudodesulfovibrio sp. zrk46]|uniref:flagellar basal body rod protein FlgC n=1 Tax=Pseudodesulfovibrio sp. zrk46 TaxID=2725288 RepID=UPI00144923CD|nr:flagellar basal body rod C-terminal domain-containing protein [Pseudodesulfovibrio sp. zrk46]QJB57341.1 flagellar basal body rod protein [Pseudodesulfovibrio sp. zrk46]